MVTAALSSVSHAKLVDPQNAGCIDCFNFVAPSVTTAESINPAEVGLIVYDMTHNSFRGLNSSFAWKRFAEDKTVVNLPTGTIDLQPGHHFVTVDTTNGPRLIKLPPASTMVGRDVLVKKLTGGGSAVIMGVNSEVIDGQNMAVLFSQNASLHLMSDGASYKILNLHDPWRVDATITGASVPLSTASVASYSPIENANLSLMNNTGTNVVSAQIPCSGTNYPSGTTCTGGSESVGINFSNGRGGDVLACVSFGDTVTLGSGTPSLIGSYQIVQTPSDAQTILQEGKSRAGFTFAGAQSSGNTHRVCGTFTLTALEPTTLRLMYMQTVVAPVTAHTINAEGTVALGKRDIHWEVIPLN